MIMKYPIGIQDFESIINGGYVYVDKTALVYRLVKEWHEGCTTPATAFALTHKVLTPGCRSARSFERILGIKVSQDGTVMSLLIRWKSAYSYLKFLLNQAVLCKCPHGYFN